MPLSPSAGFISVAISIFETNLSPPRSSVLMVTGLGEMISATSL